MSEMRLDWGSVRTLDGVGLDPGLVEAVVSARDMEQGHRDLMTLEGAVYYNRCLSEAALLVTSELVEAVCTGRCTVPCGLTMATDALYEISHGETASSETTLGSTGVADRCRDIIRDSLPRLYQTARSVTDDYTLASFVTITGLTDPDENRWNTFTQTLLDHNPEVLTADEVKNTRDWRTRNGGPAYEGCSWD
ncbi:hypothetical protein AM609_08705 [Actinomyces sp. oral taxon 414]|uniref:hypothetical protein n=1 Tax=Actinomyces sp. oral taxon 414 TaxID=712122 RepID=UPI0006B013F3|nr:hypothetical protein [Actinomyces sp. oral taxon 414]ALC99546.1 hypothetical protein AM609_08705 [Actinomyces sp. oral taxon 414]